MLVKIAGIEDDPTAWQETRDAVREFLHVTEPDPATGSEERLRLYHASFGDFLRGKKFGEFLETSHARLWSLCAEWDRLHGYEREYALRFAVEHLVGCIDERKPTDRREELWDLLCDINFLEAKAEAGSVVNLKDDFDEAVNALENSAPSESATVRLACPGVAGGPSFRGPASRVIVPVPVESMLVVRLTRGRGTHRVRIIGSPDAMARKRPEAL